MSDEPLDLQFRLPSNSYSDLISFQGEPISAISYTDAEIMAACKEGSEAICLCPLPMGTDHVAVLNRPQHTEHRHDPELLLNAVAPHLAACADNLGNIYHLQQATGVQAIL